MNTWLIFVACLVWRGSSEPIEFESFLGRDSYFSPPADSGSFDSFSNFKFISPIYEGSSRKPKFESHFSSETSDLPLYTDGLATRPQRTLSKLEKDYKSQLQKASNLNPIRPDFNSRIPSYRSEPFSSASNLNERPFQTLPDFKTSAGDNPRPSVITPLSQRVELHTGFVPMFKNPQQNKRFQSKSGSALRDLEPPILTASSTGPQEFKVSASVHSPSKVIAHAEKENLTDIQNPRSRSFSRNLNLDKDVKSLAISTSSSQSVVTRVVGGQSVDNNNPQDFLRLNTGRTTISDDAKLSAKKTLEINCNGSRDLGWCELGEKYPKKYVDQVVANCQEVIQRMYNEVPHNFEKLSDISNFKAELDNSSSSSQRTAKERGGLDAWSWAAYSQQGSLCDSETGFLRPETAKDSTGKWNIIIQTENLKQRVPLEMCRKTNSPCKKMLNCGLKSQCLQKYNYHLLLSLNPVQKHDCPFMKLYRFPSACVCHVE